MSDQIFYEQRGPSTAAKELCRRCPVRNDCLLEALSNGEQFGIWAGTTPGIRRSLLRGRCRVTCPACAGTAVAAGPRAQACISCGLTWSVRESGAAPLAA